MSLHKLTAGDGYLYLVRQVAAADSTERGRSALSDYYSAKGESPGRWAGSGLASLSHTGSRSISPAAVEELWQVSEGAEVSESQMAALFGEGLHPNAEAIMSYLTARGVHGMAAVEATRLGRRFHIRDGETGFQRALAVAYREHNTENGRVWNAPLDAPTRADDSHRRRARKVRRRVRPRARRRPRTVRLHRARHPRAHHRRRRLRLDFQSGQEHFGAVGDRAAGGISGDRASP